LGNNFISIGESVHASIPKHAAVMKKLAQMGSGAYSVPSQELDYIKDLIVSQVDDGADYIAVNLDAFGEDDPQLAVDMMVEYVKLVRLCSKGIPICIDSSNDDVLTVGLKEWYNTDLKATSPLINSIKLHTADKMFPLKKDYDYAFIGLLMDEQGTAHSVDDLYSLAKQIFTKAVGQHGFKPEEIIFDSTVFPLAIDMPMSPGEPGYTYKTFETIKKIKSDPEMRGVHFSGGITNCARDLPARKIGIMRAYVHKAIEYGLDAGIVNPKPDLSGGRPDPELLKLVTAYARMDGSMDRMNDAMMLMAQFCQSSR